MAVCLKNAQVKSKATKHAKCNDYETMNHGSKNKNTDQNDLYEELRGASNHGQTENGKEDLKLNEYTKWPGQEEDDEGTYVNTRPDRNHESALYVNTAFQKSDEAMYVNSVNEIEISTETINRSESKAYLDVHLSHAQNTKWSKDRIWKIITIVGWLLFIGAGSAFIGVTVSFLGQENPCDGYICMFNGSCFVKDGIPLCHCLDGFNGTKCDVTPCDHGELCENSGTCFIRDLKPVCACLPGFYGGNCTLTPCSSSPCQHDGVCSFSLNDSSPLCECPAGFSGRTCEETPCTSLPCKHGGVCSSLTTNPSPLCNCQYGYSGKFCEVTPCDSVSCQNNGTCFIQSGNAYCACRPGFFGNRCAGTPCTSSPCRYGGTCSYDTSNQNPICKCQQGFSGQFCEGTPCTDSPCLNKGHCKVVGNTYQCDCVDGFSGPTCKDFKCDLEDGNSSSCILYYNSENGWIRTYSSDAPEGNYYLNLGSTYVRRLHSRFFNSDVQKCVSFIHSLRYYSSYRGYMYIYQDETLISNILSVFNPLPTRYWTQSRLKLSRKTNTMISFLGYKRDYHNVIAIDNVTIHDCE